MTRLAAAFQSVDRDALRRRVEMDRTEQTDVGLIAAPDILDVPRVRFRPRVVPLPALPDVAASHFDEGDHPLGVQVVDLLVQRLEVFGIDALQVGKVLARSRALAGKLKRPLIRSFVISLALSVPACGQAVRRTIPSSAFHLRWFAVVGPVRKGGDHGDAVELLFAAVSHVVFETGSGPSGAACRRQYQRKRNVGVAHQVSPSRKNGVPSAYSKA